MRTRINESTHQGYSLKFGFATCVALVPIILASANEVSASPNYVWHTLQFDFTGPDASETDANNPFLNYRLEVDFSNGSQTITIPGYFAADGDSANTGAESGNVWRALFMPPTDGTWTYNVRMYSGSNVAVADADILSSFSRVAPDGQSGTFTVAANPNIGIGKDLRNHGLLFYNGTPYWSFAGTNKRFLKGGMNSPENLFGYEDFDGTIDEGGKVPGFLHKYEPHVPDWNAGDPVWKGTKGKGLIGAINYLSSVDANSLYIMVNTVDGDGDDTWPWTSSSNFTEYDCSKLDQWNIVFSHMQAKGLLIHLVHQEQENDLLLNNGQLGPERKLYYRELTARFSHHPALVWNLGEESSTTRTAQHRQYIDFISSIDPYGHPIVIHTRPKWSQKKTIYQNLLGYPNFSGISLQGSDQGSILLWRNLSRDNLIPWVISYDEVGTARGGLRPEAEGPHYDFRRQEELWVTFMSGGAGQEWYVGSEDSNAVTNPATSNRDRTLEDFRPWAGILAQTLVARTFFAEHLTDGMENIDEMLEGDGNDPYIYEDPSAGKNGINDDDDDFGHTPNLLCLADTAKKYIIYIKDSALAGADALRRLDLRGASGDSFTVRWFDPKSGGQMRIGSVPSVSGGNWVDLGQPPANLPYSKINRDWAVVVEVQEDAANPSVSLSEDFEAGFGIFSSGGRDALLRTNPSTNSQSLLLRDDSGVESSAALTQAIDAVAMQQIEVTFEFLASSMDNVNEDFMLEYWDGSSWVTRKTYTLGIDFQNDVAGSDSVVIAGPFTADFNLRFRCDASGNRDVVYIDNVVITGR